MKPKFSKTLGFQATGLAGASALSQVLQALGLIAAARIAGPEEFGRMAPILALGVAIAGLYDFGTNAFLARGISRGAVGVAIFFAQAKWRVAILCAIAVALSIVGSAVNVSYASLILIAPATYAFQTAQIPLKSLAQSEKLVIPIILDRLLYIAIFAGLLSISTLGVGSALLISWVLGSSLATALTFFVTPDREGKPKVSIRDSLYSKGSKHFGFFSVSNAIAGLDQTILLATSGPFQAGLFSSVARWGAPIGLISGAYTTTLAPHFNKPMSEVVAIAKKSVWLPLTAVVTGVLAFSFADFLVLHLLGSPFVDSVPVFRLLLAANIVALLNQPLAVFLQYLGKEALVAKVVGICSFTYLVSGGILSQIFAPIGAHIFAIAQVSMQTLILCLVAYSLFQMTKRNESSAQNALHTQRGPEDA